MVSLHEKVIDDSGVMLGIVILVIARLALFLVIGLSCKASAGFTSNIEMQATGGLHVSEDYEWMTSPNMTQFGVVAPPFNGGAAEKIVVTGPGMTAFKENTSLNPELASSSDLQFTNGGAYADSLFMESTSPNVTEPFCDAGSLISQGAQTQGVIGSHQWVDARVGGVGNAARYVVDKTVDGSDYGLSYRVKGTGGLFEANLLASDEAGSNTSSLTIDYTNQVKIHLFEGANLSDGFTGSVDFIWNDFSDPFNKTQSIEE